MSLFGGMSLKTTSSSTSEKQQQQQQQQSRSSSISFISDEHPPFPPVSTAVTATVSAFSFISDVHTNDAIVNDEVLSTPSSTSSPLKNVVNDVSSTSGSDVVVNDVSSTSGSDVVTSKKIMKSSRLIRPGHARTHRDRMTAVDDECNNTQLEDNEVKIEVDNAMNTTEADVVVNKTMLDDLLAMSTLKLSTIVDAEVSNDLIDESEDGNVVDELSLDTSTLYDVSIERSIVLDERIVSSEISEFEREADEDDCEDSYKIEEPVTYTITLNQEEKAVILVRELLNRMAALTKCLFDVESRHLTAVTELATACETCVGNRLLIRKLENDQALAVVAEEFEEASELADRIENLATSLDAFHAIKWDGNANNSDDMKFVKETRVLTDQIASEAKSIEADLLDVLAKHNETMIAHRCERKEAISACRRRLESKRVSVSKLMSHVELDMAHLQQDEARLNDQIEQRIAPVVTKQEVLLTEQAAIDKEIELLRSKLDSLMLNRTNVAESIANLDDSISSMKREFAEEAAEIESERNRVKQERDSLSLQTSDMNTLEDELAANKLKDELCEESSTALVNEVMTAIDNVNAGVELAVGNSEHLATFRAACINADDNGEEPLNDDVIAARNLVQACSTDLLDLEARLSSFRVELVSMQARLPKLEKDKKLTVSARNFKEAGRLSALMKDLTSQCEALEPVVYETEKKVELARVAANEASAALTEARQVVKQRELVADQHVLDNFVKAHPTLTSLLGKAVSNGFFHAARVMEMGLRVRLALAHDICVKHDLHMPNILSATSNAHLNYGIPRLAPLLEYEIANTSSPTVIDAPSVPVAVEDLIENRSTEENIADQDSDIALCKNYENAISNIEDQINIAVDVENFDRAAELDIESDVLKNQLHILVAKLAAKGISYHSYIKVV